jgi:NADH-quinone oxidoreductase subunit L
LAAGAVGVGWVGIPSVLGGGAQFAEFLKPIVWHPEFHGTHAQEFAIMGLSTTIALTGLVIAAIFYLVKTGIPVRLALNFSVIYRILFNKYYVDELYHYALIKPTLWLANSFIGGVTDAKIIEGIVNGVPKAIGRFAHALRKVQTGLTQHYAIIMAAGVMIIIMLMLW